MLIEWFLAFVGGLLTEVFTVVLGVLPDDIGLGALAPAFGLMMSLNNLFPVVEGIAAFLVVLGVTLVMFVVKLVQAGVAHIPFVGGSGG